MRNRERLVWLIDEQVEGHIVGSMGAFFTMIAYHRGGMDYEVLVENDDFELIEGDVIDDDDE